MCYNYFRKRVDYMLILRIIFTSIALLFMIVTFIMYIDIKKTLKSHKKVIKKDLEVKTKRFNIMIIISIVLSIIAIVITVIENSTEIKKNANINATNYEIYIKKYKENDDINAELDYFPDNVNASNVIEFSEYRKNGLFSKSYFILLKYQYSKSELISELERIKLMSIENIEDNQNPYYIYLISNEDNIKEYVLLDNNSNQLIYVFNQRFSKKDVEGLSDYFVD